MKQTLLHRVFDEGIRQWLIAKFDTAIAAGMSEAEAFTQTSRQATEAFGNWKAK